METLVLSAAWEPMYRVGWQQAMTLWAAGRAELVEPWPDRYVHSVREAFPVPAVLRFLRGRRPFPSGVRFNRTNVYARDRGRCQYCGEDLSRRAATYDHVVPRSLGGGTTWRNIVLACLPCNQRKRDRTPEQAGMRLLARPEAPRGVGVPDALVPAADVPAPWRPYLGLSGLGG